MLDLWAAKFLDCRVNNKQDAKLLVSVEQYSEVSFIDPPKAMQSLIDCTNNLNE